MTVHGPDLHQIVRQARPTIKEIRYFGILMRICNREELNRQDTQFASSLYFSSKDSFISTWLVLSILVLRPFKARCKRVVLEKIPGRDPDSVAVRPLQRHILQDLQHASYLTYPSNLMCHPEQTVRGYCGVS